MNNRSVLLKYYIERGILGVNNESCTEMKEANIEHALVNSVILFYGTLYCSYDLHIVT